MNLILFCNFVRKKYLSLNVRCYLVKSFDYGEILWVCFDGNWYSIVVVFFMFVLECWIMLRG